jgi:RHS repeat-associated protein
VHPRRDRRLACCQRQTDQTATDHAGSSPAEPLRFAGQYLDPVTSQYQMRARWYDATAMRFDSLDPVVGAITDPATGPYVYANGDPASLTDPTGQSAAPTCANASVRDFPSATITFRRSKTSGPIVAVRDISNPYPVRRRRGY